jgi:uncharacterized protein with HEPN domain
MYDRELVKEVLSQILTALSRIERRSALILKPDDFLSTDEGIDKLDAICMMLIAMGESLKYIDKLTDNKLLACYPGVDWKGAKGVRDILSHHYFDLNADIVFNICKEKVPGIIEIIKTIISELE